jgi:hypothetical protein
MWKIVFRNHGEVMAEWLGYLSYSEARDALRGADSVIPISWEHEIESYE